jgi:methylmalonyl-CoA mutase
VNKHRLKEEDAIETLVIDNHKVRDTQIERLNHLRTNRNDEAVMQALEDLTEYARSGKGNGLDLAIKAARLRASVGEITYSLERVWGRYNAHSQTVTGVYGKSFEKDENWMKITEDIKLFVEKYGRRPRMLVAKMGQDGHDRGAKVIATAFADVGFDIDLAPLFSTPAEVAKQAVENDVHVVGVSSQAAGHKTLIPDLIAELKKLGADDIIVVCGGVIPKADYDFLTKAGVKGIYGPGTVIPVAARDVLVAIEKNLIGK